MTFILEKNKQAEVGRILCSDAAFFCVIHMKQKVNI